MLSCTKKIRHGGPVANTLHSQRQGSRFDPWSANDNPPAITKSFYVATKDPVCCKEDQRAYMLEKPNK